MVEYISVAQSQEDFQVYSALKVIFPNLFSKIIFEIFFLKKIWSGVMWLPFFILLQDDYFQAVNGSLVSTTTKENQKEVAFRSYRFKYLHVQGYP